MVKFKSEFGLSAALLLSALFDQSHSSIFDLNNLKFLGSSFKGFIINCIQEFIHQI